MHCQGSVPNHNRLFTYPHQRVCAKEFQNLHHLTISQSPGGNHSAGLTVTTIRTKQTSTATRRGYAARQAWHPVLPRLYPPYSPPGSVHGWRTSPSPASALYQGSVVMPSTSFCGCGEAHLRGCWPGNLWPGAARMLYGKCHPWTGLVQNPKCGTDDFRPGAASLPVA